MTGQITYEEESILSCRSMGINILQTGGCSVVSLPVWRVEELMDGELQFDLLIANDCLQEMEIHQARAWLDWAGNKLSKNGLVIVIGSGAPRGWYLYEALAETNLHPLFIGRKSIPFVKKWDTELFDVHMIGRKDSPYFKDMNNRAFLSKEQLLKISRGAHGEVVVGTDKAGICYIHPTCGYDVEYFIGKPLIHPKSSGIYVNGEEI